MSTIQIGGKKYPCEVKNGIRYVDGKTVDEFMSTLSFNELLDLAMLGKKVSKGLKSGSPQATLHAIEYGKNKN